MWMLTGVDTEGKCIIEFGSSEGQRRTLVLGRAGVHQG